MRTPELLFQKLTANGFLWKLPNFFFHKIIVAYITRSSHQRKCSTGKMVFLKNYQNLLENTCVRVSFLLKLHACGLQLYIKRLVQVFSCGFCKILKNFLTEHLRMPASQNICSIKKLPWKVYQNSQEKGLSFMKFRLTTYSFTKKEPYIWPRCFSVNFSENFNSNLFIRQNQLPRGVL